MITGPRSDLVFVDENLAVIQPGIEFRQCLVVVVLADTAIQSVIPSMHAADQVGAVDMTIGHECAAVRASAVKHTDGFVEAHHDQVNIGDNCVCRNAVFQLIPILDGQLVHRRVPLHMIVIFPHGKCLVVGRLRLELVYR